MSQNQEEKILIVGAGPTGLALAIQLATYGISFRIIDKNKGPGTSSRAMLVVPRILEQYQSLGLAEDIISKGMKIKGVKIWVEGKRKAEIELENIGEGESAFPYMLTFPQDEHEALLIEKLERLNYRVEWQTECLSIRQEDEFVTVKTQLNGKQETSKFVYVVGCDGASSTVRKQLDFSFEGGTYDELFYVLDAKLNKEVLLDQEIDFHFSNEEFALFFPLRNQETTRVIGMFPSYLVKEEKADFEHLHPFLESAFDYQLQEMKWFSTYSVHHRVAEKFQKKQVFLIGDAAHIHSPVGGQGMNAGIGDAFNLGWKLAAVLQNKADKEILNTYEKERKGFAEQLVSTTDQIFKVAASTGNISKLIRKQLVPFFAEPAMNRIDFIRNRYFRMLSQIRVSYEKSPLSEGKVKRVQAGLRFPFTKNHVKILSEKDWQLVVYGKAKKEMKKLAKDYSFILKEFEWDEKLKETKIIENATYFIRPDGYIAWLSLKQDSDSLEKYIKKWTIKPLLNDT